MLYQVCYQEGFATKIINSQTISQQWHIWTISVAQKAHQNRLSYLCILLSIYYMQKESL